MSGLKDLNKVKEDPTLLDGEIGTAFFKKINDINLRVNALLDDQPDKEDLNSAFDHLSQISAWTATLSSTATLAELLYSIASIHEISKAVDSSEYKAIKNSSTLVDRFTTAKCPVWKGLFNRSQLLLKALKTDADNWRTIISAQKSERELSLRTVRQH